MFHKMRLPQFLLVVDNECTLGWLHKRIYVFGHPLLLPPVGHHQL